MSTTPRILAPDLVWTADGFVSDLQVRLDADGRIAEIGTDLTPNAAPGEPLAVERLAGRALLPGFVNVHSHAFQRGLRGRGETFSAPGADSADDRSEKERLAKDNFWSWREAMYDLVGSLDAAAFKALCRRAFREMLRCGITTVGEFHYLHHLESSCDYALDALVLEAAAEAGIRIALLQACYMTGGIEQPLRGAQKRFECDSLDAYWRQMDRLAGLLDPGTQSLGVVAHSIRAVPPADLEELHAEARARGMVFHMHVEEQRLEIAEAMRVYSRRPMALLNERLDIGPHFVAVHCTHTDPRDMAAFLAAGGQVCICPLTEGNLGDGIADLPGMLAGESSRARRHGGAICLGTDSNSRLSMTEEMRWLEYAQRLRQERRGVARDGEGRVGRRLFAAATAAGAAALDVEAGEIAPGRWADLITLDLAAPSLDGWTPDTLLDAFIFGARDEVVAEVMVGGRWVVGAAS